MENQAADIINQMANYGSFHKTWAFERYVRLNYKIIGLFTGNQSMKTASTAYQYVMRIFGTHPVAKRNVLYLECQGRAKLAQFTYDPIEYRSVLKGFLDVHKSKDSATWRVDKYPKEMVCPECGDKIVLHKRKSRIFRFASQTLPTEKEDLGGDTAQSAEINNTQYPEFKKWLPKFLIKKDITVRNPAIIINDPLAGKWFGDQQHLGADIVVEFQSYVQAVQAGAGVQRMSCWCDEEPPFDFFEEQFPRLLVEDGDIIVSVTPANGMTWTYDDIFEKAALYIRTPVICEYYIRDEGWDECSTYEVTDSDKDIAVIQAATDDNPTLSPDVIEDSYKNTPDPDGTIVATRRYGIFKQATGRIFKDFRYNLHVIDLNKYGITPETLTEWIKGRSFDFHPANPHAIVWVAISPTNEAFVYGEWNPSPSTWVTSRLCEELGLRSGFDKFVCNLIDPLANTVNTNTGLKTIEEMNDCFRKLKMRGICGGAYWEPFATKGEVGRDKIKERLQNAVKCKTPFNNAYIQDGIEMFHPTIWIDRSCQFTANSMRHWRLETWVSNKQLTVKDKKETPAQKWSHFCTALEGLFKDPRFKAKRKRTYQKHQYRKFQGGR